MRKLAFAGLALLCVVSGGQASELPVLQAVGISASVTLNPGTGIFTYDYAISNPSSNTGQIWRVELDISRPDGSLELPSTGLTNGSRFHRATSELAQKKVPMIPVGVSPPPNWGVGLTVGATVSWGSGGEEFRIFPGQGLAQFTVSSYGIPAIRSLKIYPRFELDPVDFATAEDVKKHEEIEQKTTFKTKTVGPTAPPANFVALDFLSSIISLKEESFALGWIDRSGIKQSLDAKLENAKKKLAGGDIKTAKNILNAVLNEVEAQKEKHLTSEAHALLKFNVEFLLSKI